jgi:hypothetical protein
MEYRAVKNRCAVVLDFLRLPISNEKALTLLKNKGFVVVNVDIIALARQCIKISKYRRGARLFEAPNIVDCSSLVKWFYAQRGIWLPRRSIQQHRLGEVVDIDKIIVNDLVFISGWIDYYDDDPKNGVGHVGIATGSGTIIHASDNEVNVVESSLDEFVGDKNKFRGARRYIPSDKEVLTLEAPINREVETADDIKWIILQSL